MHSKSTRTHILLVFLIPFQKSHLQLKVSFASQSTRNWEIDCISDGIRDTAQN